MPTFHNPGEAIAYLRSLPAHRWKDGVSAVEWKRAAREKKGKSGVIRMVWPVDLADRFRAVKEWFHETYHEPPLIQELMLRRLETRTVLAECPRCSKWITVWVVADEKELAEDGQNATTH